MVENKAIAIAIVIVIVHVIVIVIPIVFEKSATGISSDDAIIRQSESGTCPLTLHVLIWKMAMLSYVRFQNIIIRHPLIFVL